MVRVVAENRLSSEEMVAIEQQIADAVANEEITQQDAALLMQALSIVDLIDNSNVISHMQIGTGASQHADTTKQIGLTLSSTVGDTVDYISEYSVDYDKVRQPSGITLCNVDSILQLGKLLGRDFTEHADIVEEVAQGKALILPISKGGFMYQIDERSGDVRQGEIESIKLRCVDGVWNIVARILVHHTTWERVVLAAPKDIFTATLSYSPIRVLTHDAVKLLGSRCALTETGQLRPVVLTRSGRYKKIITDNMYIYEQDSVGNVCTVLCSIHEGAGEITKALKRANCPTGSIAEVMTVLREIRQYHRTITPLWLLPAYDKEVETVKRLEGLKVVRGQSQYARTTSQLKFFKQIAGELRYAGANC